MLKIVARTANRAFAFQSSHRRRVQIPARHLAGAHRRAAPLPARRYCVSCRIILAQWKPKPLSPRLGSSLSAANAIGRRSARALPLLCANRCPASPPSKRERTPVPTPSFGHSPLPPSDFLPFHFHREHSASHRHCPVFAREHLREKFPLHNPPQSLCSRLDLPHVVAKPPRASLLEPKPAPTTAPSSPTRRRPPHRGQPASARSVDDAHLGKHRHHPLMLTRPFDF